MLGGQSKHAHDSVISSSLTIFRFVCFFICCLFIVCTTTKRKEKESFQILSHSNVHNYARLMDMDEAMKSHVKEMMDTGYPFEIESGANDFRHSIYMIH